MNRIILMGRNSRFPSAVARFGVIATYSGAVSECQPGLPVLSGGQVTQKVFRRTDPIAEAAGRPSKPAADLAVNCMRWIGERIASVNSIKDGETT